VERPQKKNASQAQEHDHSPDPAEDLAKTTVA
jgi:hypothetical protein